MLRIQLRSAPAQKAGPRPASTMARTSGCCPRSRKAWVSSAITVSLKALRTSGRFRVTRATGPVSTVMVLSAAMWGVLSKFRTGQNLPRGATPVGCGGCRNRPAVRRGCRCWFAQRASNAQGFSKTGTSHAEDTKSSVFDRCIAGGRQAQGQHAAGVGGVDHAVVPQAGGGVVGVALVFVLLTDRGLEGFFFVSAPLAALGLDAVTLDGGQHAGRLLAAHDADAGVGPHPQEARAVGAAAHAVVAGAEAAANDDGELGHAGRGHRRDHLGAIAGNAFVLVLAAHHEAGDVLQEHQRDLALAA